MIIVTHKDKKETGVLKNEHTKDGREYYRVKVSGKKNTTFWAAHLCSVQHILEDWLTLPDFTKEFNKDNNESFSYSVMYYRITLLPAKLRKREGVHIMVHRNALTELNTLHPVTPIEDNPYSRYMIDHPAHTFLNQNRGE